MLQPVRFRSVDRIVSMETITVRAARAMRWAATLVCSLCFAMPCTAGPFAADANGPPDLEVAAALPPVGDDAAADAGATLPSAPLLADVSLSSAPDDPRAASVPGDAVVRADSLAKRGYLLASVSPGDTLVHGDSLAGMLESLLDQGLRVPGTEKTYRALPGTSGTPPMMAAGPASQSPARDGSMEPTWRETGFNVMRWTSAALAVLAVVGIVMVLAMPGLRRRIFFPEMPPMPPRPA